jgi:hypothetical protein
MRRAAIAEQDAYLVARHRTFRHAADVVTDAWARFPEVVAVSLIGSAARPLWKEVPRFAAFRKAGIAVWHECKDVDLAVWIEDLSRLQALRRAAVAAMRDTPGLTVADHQVDVFLIEPGTDRYRGRLCYFSTCPKGHADCAAPGCGATPFLKQDAGFTPGPDLLAPSAFAMLYRRGQGRLRSALDLPALPPGG